MKYWYFWRTLFFRLNEIIFWGKKHMALFQTHNWKKSSFFQHAHTCSCEVIRKYVTGEGNVPPNPPGFNRVNEPVFNFFATNWMYFQIFATKISYLPISEKKVILKIISRSARTSCTTSDPSVRPQEKSGSLIDRHTCLMNHQKSHVMSGGPLSCPLSCLLSCPPSCPLSCQGVLPRGWLKYYSKIAKYYCSPKNA